MNLFLCFGNNNSKGGDCLNSYWIASSINDGKFKQLDKNISCDVCIIGAGMFGLSTAYYLSKKRLNVIVLDKSDIGTKTSGHTTAKITSQHGLIYDYLINSFGKDIAKKYLDANQDAIKNIQEIINAENIECDFETQNNFIYADKQKDLDKIKKEVSAVKSLGLDCQLVNQTKLPFDTLGAIMFLNQAQFHPRKYMLGLCKAIVENNGHIFTNTLVHNIKKEDNFYKK